MINKILVPVDGSDHSKKALEFGCDLASKYSAELCLMHVFEWVPGSRTFVLGSAYAAIPVKPEEFEKPGRSMLAAATELANSLGVTPVYSECRSGSPAKEILEVAESQGVDTIIMGSRGLSDFGGMRMGSVSHKVGHLATCTCITIR